LWIFELHILKYPIVTIENIHWNNLHYQGNIEKCVNLLTIDTNIFVIKIEIASICGGLCLDVAWCLQKMFVDIVEPKHVSLTIFVFGIGFLWMWWLQLEFNLLFRYVFFIFPPYILIVFWAHLCVENVPGTCLRFFIIS
jgi:hypothetical protein